MPGASTSAEGWNWLARPSIARPAASQRPARSLAMLGPPSLLGGGGCREDPAQPRAAPTMGPLFPHGPMVGWWEEGALTLMARWISHRLSVANSGTTECE